MFERKKWLLRLHIIFETNLDDPALDNGQLAKKLQISKRHLFRKVHELTGMSPKKYLNAYRIKKAKRYLANGTYRTVKETAYAVGFKNPSYFIRQFKVFFNKSPFQILKEEGWR